MNTAINFDRRIIRNICAFPSNLQAVYNHLFIVCDCWHDVEETQRTDGQLWTRASTPVLKARLLGPGERPVPHGAWWRRDISKDIQGVELSHTHEAGRGRDSSISKMVLISFCRLACSAKAVVSPSHAHSFPDARKTSGVGLVPPRQPIPHVGSVVLTEVLLELQSPVEVKK